MGFRGILINETETQVDYWNSPHERMESVAKPCDTGPLSVGEWYEYHHTAIKPSSNTWDNYASDTNTKPAIWKDRFGNVSATVLQFPCPKDGSVSEAIAKKYNGTVWSCFLGLMKAPSDFPIEEICEVNAKLVDGEFQVVGRKMNGNFEISDWILDMAPWNQEMKGRDVWTKEETREYLATKHKVEDIHPLHHFTHSVCLASREIISPVRGPQVHHFLFNMELGVIRTGSCNNVRFEVGGWYQHLVNDSRREQMWSERRPSIFESCKAISSKPMSSPLEEMENPVRHERNRREGAELNYIIRFPFVHDKLEGQENKTIPWPTRRDGLKNNAHTWHQILGKVEIYRCKSAFIIKAVEALPKYFRREPIEVVAVASLHHNHEDNFPNYPEMGLFLVTRLLELRNQRGETIAQF